MYAMLAAMKSQHVNQSSFLCRLFDQLVYPVLSYGCQVWGPDIFHDRYTSPQAMVDRSKNPIEGVHIDFLRILGGLPSSSPLWILFTEFARTPLHFHWLVLCTRFWVKAVGPLKRPDLAAMETESNVLLREAMVDNIKLGLHTPNCWVSKFMKSLVCIGVISGEELSACETVEHFINLPIDENYVRLCLHKFWTSACASVFYLSCQPRHILDDTPITYHRYNSWVTSKEDPPHLTAFLPTSLKHMIIRFRVSGYPLAFQSTKLKRQKTPRSHRYCAACQKLSPCVKVMEDDLHFWIECPAYSEIRKSYPSLFHIDASPISILNTPDQVLLGKVLSLMLEIRSKI
jgi:hypothetical protein